MTATTLPDRAHRAAHGARVVVVGQAVRFVLQLAGLAALARLLTPADFGLVAMVTAVVGVAEVLRDFGLSSAAVQARRLSEQQQSNLFWLNGAIGVALAGGLVLVGPLVERFYGTPGVATVVALLAPAVLLSALSTQFRARLNREMRFTALAVSDVVAQAAALVVAVSIALARGDFVALVGQQLTLALVALCSLALWTRWLPGRPRRGAGMAHLLRFGGNVAATQLLGYLSRNVDTLVVGRVLGDVAVGVYSRAFQLLMLPLSQINAPATTVALPVLSRSQDDPADFRRLVVRSQGILLTVVLGAVSLLFTAAPLVVEVFLGPQWEDAVPILRLLCVAARSRPPGTSPTGASWASASRGRTCASRS
ncbi:lipopolysaccharide biosynthesis protein [Cellulosimicrobium sp. CUA-896]|uniref:lipopolysaccharide biosynthesis protein n=1 Tax=Cellulosimicrobium sp. CUA-896 TaxID=1517881 RepID=UPI000963EC16|nr:lipopolysaccharide biosynthesis protein [Cellulosimicrobium sp. CUA-896]OLT52244.1 hypothetical protein BJF88_14200 [Cellulosimicrobium sp. CUA-896]